MYQKIHQHAKKHVLPERIIKSHNIYYTFHSTMFVKYHQHPNKNKLIQPYLHVEKLKNKTMP